MNSLITSTLVTLALVAGGDAGHAEGVDIARYELALTLATWAAFLMLATIMGKFAWGPFMQALDEREAQIADDVKRAENARDEAERLLEEYNQKLRASKDEAAKIMADARETAEGIAAKINEDARKASEDMSEKARKQIEAEREKAIAALNKIVANAAVDLAGKLIEEDLDPKKHQKLIDSELADIDKLA